MNYQQYTQEQLPDQYKQQLSSLMQKAALEFMKLPPPDTQYYQSLIEKNDDEFVLKYALAIVDDNIAGYAHFGWSSSANPRVLQLREIFVEKEYRRKQIGKNLLRTMLDGLPDTLEKMIYTTAVGTAGEEFFSSMIGTEPCSYFTRSVLKLGNLEYQEVCNTAKELRKKAEDKGYEFHYIQDAEFSRIGDISDYVTMFNQIHLDVPMDDREVELAEKTIANFLGVYHNYLAMDYRYHTYYVTKNGKSVAMTEVALKPHEDGIWDQLMTGVLSSHRGNRLGITLKFLMLQKVLEESGARFLATDNAESNVHMWRINKQLGYEKTVKKALFEATIGDIGL